MYAALVIALAPGAQASSPMTDEQLAAWVTGVERDRGCVVVVAVPAAVVGHARDAVERVARVISVHPDEWDAWTPSEIATQGRCVVKAQERTPGIWEAEFVGLAPPVGAGSRAPLDPGHAAIELGSSAIGGALGAFVGFLGGAIADQACVNYTSAAGCTINVGEAVGMGVGAGLAAGTTAWAVGGIGRVHGSLPWTLATSSLGAAGGTLLLAISSDPAKEPVGLVLDLAGPPLAATIGTSASLHYDATDAGD